MKTIAEKLTRSGEEERYVATLKKKTQEEEVCSGNTLPSWPAFDIWPPYTDTPKTPKGLYKTDAHTHTLGGVVKAINKYSPLKHTQYQPPHAAQHSADNNLANSARGGNNGAEFSPCKKKIGTS